MDTSRKILLAIIAIIIFIVAAFSMGVLSSPDADIKNNGEWGEVTDESIEIITTVWVENPNVIGFNLGGSVDVTYDLHLNGINLASGESGKISLHSGRNTIELSTYIENDEMSQWWVAFIKNEETIPVRAESSARIGGPVSFTADIPEYEETLFPDSTPAINSISQTVSNLSGEYPDDGPISIEIREAWAEWGEVDERQTTVNLHVQIHNPNRVSIPAEPENLGLDIEMNGIEMFSARSNDVSLENRNDFDERLIDPGETKEAIYAVEMDNDKIEDWFVSHIERGEQTVIRTELRLVFSANGRQISIPDSTPVSYTCELRTDIFNGESDTDCLKLESLDAVDEAENVTGDETDGSGDDAGNDDSGGDDAGNDDSGNGEDGSDEGQRPNANAEANPTSGEASLEVEFDASESTDPDGDIEQYIWRFKDGTPPAEGETVTHTFRTAGEYEVDLVVIDSQENQNTDTVTITVDSRIG